MIKIYFKGRFVSEHPCCRWTYADHWINETKHWDYCYFQIIFGTRYRQVSFKQSKHHQSFAVTVLVSSLLVSRQDSTPWVLIKPSTRLAWATTIIKTAKKDSIFFVAGCLLTIALHPHVLSKVTRNVNGLSFYYVTNLFHNYFTWTNSQ